MDGHPDWPDGSWTPLQEGDSGVAVVFVAARGRGDRLSVCVFLIDTWCLGVKNAAGPRSMIWHDFETLRRRAYSPWDCDGILVSLELAQHLVLGAVHYARGLGFEPHRDFWQARRALGSWRGPSAVRFGRHGRPHYVNGPYENPQQVLASLQRAVGRAGFDHTLSLDELDRVA